MDIKELFNVLGEFGAWRLGVGVQYGLGAVFGGGIAVQKNI